MHARDGQPKRLFSECRVSIGVKNEGRIEQNIFPIQLVGLGGGGPNLWPTVEAE